MKNHTGALIWFIIVFTLQRASTQDHNGLMSLQLRIENLIEKIILVVHDFYGRLKTEEKCLPEEIPDSIMEILKNSIECVDEVEKKHQGAIATFRNHNKSFLRCFQEAKKEVENLLSNINLDINYCPENMSEKSYEINVTTSYTKRFKINIKNGLEVTKKVIEMNEQDHVMSLCPHQGNQGDVYDMYDLYDDSNNDQNQLQIHNKENPDQNYFKLLPDDDESLSEDAKDGLIKPNSPGYTDTINTQENHDDKENANFYAERTSKPLEIQKFQQTDRSILHKKIPI